MIFFSHIPKSAGETIANIFISNYGQEKCLMVYDKLGGGDVDPTEFLNLEPSYLKKFDVIIGHLPIPLFLSNKFARQMFDLEEVMLVSSVRSPIDRIISEYNYTRFNEHHPDHYDTLNMSLAVFLEKCPANLQTYYLAPDMSLAELEAYPNKGIFPISTAISGISDIVSARLSRELDEVQTVNVTANMANGRSIANIDELSEIDLQLNSLKHDLDFKLFSLASSGALTS